MNRPAIDFSSNDADSMLRSMPVPSYTVTPAEQHFATSIIGTQSWSEKIYVCMLPEYHKI